MDVLTTSTAFATMVGLICNFRQEKGQRRDLDHKDFIEWLEYHRHEEIKNLICNTYHDVAAATTIDRLNLRDGELTAMRKAAIDAVLGQTRNLSLKTSRRKLRDLEQARAGRLVPFCFAVKPALRKFIGTIEAIRASKRAKQ